MHTYQTFRFRPQGGHLYDDYGSVDGVKFMQLEASWHLAR